MAREREPQRILKLYQCSAPNNELHKEKWLSNEKAISPYIPKDNNSISNPHIIIHTFEKDEEHPVSLIAYNYCYIDDYQRYYFIEDMILLPQGQVEIVCKVDVLYSFKNSIGELVVQESRATNGTSNYLIDNEVATQINAKPIVLPMKFNGTKLSGMSLGSIQWIVRYYSHLLFYKDDVLGIWNSLNGAAPNTILELGDDVKPTVTQEDIGKHIAELAINLYDGYDSYLNRLSNSNYSGYKVPCGYTQTGTRPTSSYNVNMCYVDSTFAPIWKRTWYGVPATRYDSAFSDTASIEFNGTTRNTNLNIINIAMIEQWNSDHPNLPIDEDKFPHWNSWDCSQFAWRCCLFNNGKANPIDVNNSSVGSGYNCSTGSILKFLSNSGCLVKNVLTPADLKAGDLIFSGKADESNARYWVGYDENANEWKYTDTKSQSASWTNVIGINHVRVYVGGEGDGYDFIDTIGNYTDETSEPTGNLHSGSIGELTYNPDTDYDKVSDTEESIVISKNNTRVNRIRVCRPSLLWGSQYQT